MHHAFLYISLLSLHDYYVKLPIMSRFVEDVNTRQGPFFSLNFTDVLDFEFLCDVNQTVKVRCLLSRPLRKQVFTTVGSKGHGFVICDWWISILFVCFCVSRLFAFEL